MQTLRQEYAVLDSEKRKLYSGYKHARQEMIEWQTAKHNVDVLFNQSKQREKRHERDER
jgi:hypothetical protein